MSLVCARHAALASHPIQCNHGYSIDGGGGDQVVEAEVAPDSTPAAANRAR